jgi:arylsulfatase A-like enzyme
LRPQQHGVRFWGDKLPDELPTIFDIENINSGFFHQGGDFEALWPVIGISKMTTLDDLTPPFIYLERDNFPHIPYGENENDETSTDYLRRIGNYPKSIQKKYAESIQKTESLFESRLRQLEQRGLLEETLVIFTSDHGELLGEYGETIHSAPACPELTYVPTTFIHPDITEDSFYPDPGSDVIEHIDIVETFLQLLDESTFATEGVDLTQQNRKMDPGYTFSAEKKFSHQFYRNDSLWWYNGGYTFSKNAIISRLCYFAYRLVNGPGEKQLRQNLKSSAKIYAKKEQKWGDPPIKMDEARDIMRNLINDIDERGREDAHLSEEAKDQLQKLGYLQ